MAKVTIEQFKSISGSNPRQRATMEALGFKRSRRVLVKEMTPQIKGMIAKMAHLVRIVKEQ